MSLYWEVQYLCEDCHPASCGCGAYNSQDDKWEANCDECGRHGTILICTAEKVIVLQPPMVAETVATTVVAPPRPRVRMHLSD